MKYKTSLELGRNYVTFNSWFRNELDGSAEIELYQRGFLFFFNVLFKYCF